MPHFPQFLAGETLPAARLNALATEFTWTPIIENPGGPVPMGTSPPQEGYGHLVGAMVTLWFRVGFGSGSTPGTDSLYVPLPAAYPSAGEAVAGTLGVAQAFDFSTGDTPQMTCQVIAGSSQHIQFRTLTNGSPATGLDPFTFADNDWLAGSVAYVTDFGGA